MSVTKELIEKEKDLVQAGQVRDLHLHREGTFIRAYGWSAWLACKYLHDFKVNKRTFKGIDEPVAYIGFPETSLEKWIPEGAVQRLENEKYLVVTLPELMITDTYETMAAAYNEWKNALPLTESNPGLRKKGSSKDVGMPEADDAPVTLTAIMQRVLAFPIESKSPLESVVFLSEIKERLAALI